MMRIRDLFRRMVRLSQPSRSLLTTEIAAREYARLCCSKQENNYYEELNAYCRQGRLLFADMSRFDDDSRAQSLEAFTAQFIAPLVIGELKKRLTPAAQG